MTDEPFTYKRKTITSEMKLAAMRRLNHTIPCYKCGEMRGLGDVQWDHIQALVDGGEHTPDNLAPICFACHVGKSKLEAKRNSKFKRLLQAKVIHDRILKGEYKRPKSRIAARPFQKPWRPEQ